MEQVFYTFLITTETPEEGMEYFVIKHDEKMNLRVFPMAEEDIYNWVDNPRYKDILTDNSYRMFRDCLPKNLNDISGFSYIKHKIISIEVIEVSRDRFDWINTEWKFYTKPIKIDASAIPLNITLSPEEAKNLAVLCDDSYEENNNV